MEIQNMSGKPKVRILREGKVAFKGSPAAFKIWKEKHRILKRGGVQVDEMQVHEGKKVHEGKSE